MKLKIIIILLLLLSIDNSFAQKNTRETIKINDLVDAKSDNDNSQNGSSIFLGIKAGDNDDQSNNRNIGIGFHSLRNNVNGSSNIAIGNYALQMNSNDNNVAIGDLALYRNIKGSNNIAIGCQAGGFYEGKSDTSMLNKSIFIGYNSKAYSNTDENEIVIGNNLIGNGSNSITLGNDKNKKTILTGNIGIGTKSPKHKLDVVGNIRLLNVFDNVHLYIDGSKGNSDIIFQKKSKFGGSVGYNADEDYLFLYKGGNVKVKNGNLIVDNDYQYNKPKTYTKQLSSFSFIPSKLNNKIGRSDNGSCMFIGLNGIDAMNLFANLDLPQGAKIIKFRIITANANSFVKASIFQRPLLSRKETTIATITASGLFDIRESYTNVVNAPAINNHNNNYYIKVRIINPNVENFTEFYGVFIDYTLDKVSL